MGTLYPEVFSPGPGWPAGAVSPTVAQGHFLEVSGSCTMTSAARRHGAGQGGRPEPTVERKPGSSRRSRRTLGGFIRRHKCGTLRVEALKPQRGRRRAPSHGGPAGHFLPRPSRSPLCPVWQMLARRAVYGVNMPVAQPPQEMEVGPKDRRGSGSGARTLMTLSPPQFG